ncbi:MAG: Asp-tRNA(Asn)/Glu-tRNA(Gln) amidotransferase subunit GatB [Patescibacteria group bacterium]
MTSKPYITTVGLEVHAELKTETKMFCRSKNDPHAAQPNTHICPVCMAYPGTLPVINKKAVHHVLRVGAAVNGALADFTEFDRKNYFYPDLPKGYQLSQYKFPLVVGGMLRDVALTRIHLEEDSARSQHLSDKEGGDEWSLVDYNRAGVPLMELVTEPVIHDAKTAALFAQELQLLLRTLGASDANMEKGEMRVEANISVSQDSAVFGTKVEVKNLNSFKSVEKAIEYEVARHITLLEKREQIVQETRGWDETKQKTFSQRLKENSQDYRYFPDPDLPKLYLSRIPEFTLKNIVSSLPELPAQKRERYIALGVKNSDAEMLVFDFSFATFFDQEVLAKTTDKNKIKIASNYLLSDVRGAYADSLDKFAGGVFFELVELVESNQLSSRGAKEVLAVIAKEGGRPLDVAKSKGFLQVHDIAQLKTYAEEVVSENPAVVADLKAGKESALQFLVGQGMKKSKGSANPKELAELIKSELGL